MPFPEQYVRGIDVQKFDFEQGKWSYLRGEQQRGGWWHYYLYALAIKTPIGTLALFIFAVVLSLRRCIERSPASPSSHTNDVQQGGNSATAGSSHTLVVLLPAVVVLALVSSQLGFNRYVRYVLPALPWLYIFASRTATVLARQRPLQSALVLLAVGATVIESLAVFPHSLSFFNQCVGGPRGGHAHLVDANIDWGQDLLYLQEWYEQHLQARPLHVAYFGPAGMDPQYAGIDWRPVPKYDPNPTRHAQPEDTAGPQPGWFAVSVNYLRGYRHYEYDRPVYTYFLELEPVAMAGSSMYIYHLTLPDANRLRAERGLPPLPDRPQRDATP